MAAARSGERWESRLMVRESAAPHLTDRQTDILDPDTPGNPHHVLSRGSGANPHTARSVKGIGASTRRLGDEKEQRDGVGVAVCWIGRRW